MKRSIISENHDVTGEPLMHSVGNKVKSINLNFHSFFILLNVITGHHQKRKG